MCLILKNLREMSLRDEDSSNPFENYWMEGDSLAPPCQTDNDVIDSIFEIAQIGNDSVIYDLGCGDGRICIEATERYGCISYGVEIEENLILRFRESISLKNLCDKVHVVHGDLRDIDITHATVIFLYLLPEAIQMIESKLINALRRGAILICNTWGPKSLTPSMKIVCGHCNNVTLLRYDSDSLRGLSF